MSNPVNAIERLHDVDWTVPAPFTLNFPDGGVLTFKRVLRWLPGRRVSGEACWNGKTVFAKLFIGEAAQRHGRREQAGLVALRQHAIPTPELLSVVTVPGAGVLVLSEFLSDARTLDGAAADLAGLLPAFALLGKLHAAQLVHDDLHLGNFLCQGERIFLIDGDGIRPASQDRLPDNLALLLSQLPVFLDSERRRLLDAYARTVDAGRLEQRVEQWRLQRLQRFLAKTGRNCTEFTVDRDNRHFSVRRRDTPSALVDLLAQPDAAIESGRRLKSGATCTVAAGEVDTRSVVIKRYNLKNWRHALSRAWRPSRAWHSWREAYRLAFYGIATPLPLAVLEERRGLLRGRAFLVTEYCPGASLLDTLVADSVPHAELAREIPALFGMLGRLRITHGDLKASNLLWYAGRLQLIDLDAMTQHRSTAAFRRAWQRDRARLLRNWPAGSVLHDWLTHHLPPA